MSKTTLRTGSELQDESPSGGPDSISREPDEAVRPKRWTRHLPLVAVGSLALAVLFYDLGAFRTFGSHEAFLVVPAREMARSGDWVVPRFGGVPRLKKPPLGYWIAAGSAWLFGDWSEWTMRLPSAVAALGLVVLMGWWAGRRYGRPAGIGAALVQCTSVYMVIFARKAEVDMLLLLLCTGCMFLIVEQPEGEPRKRAFLRWTGIYALLSLAWMCKFHYGPAMVLAPCLVFYAVQRRFRDLRYLANPLGLLLVAAAVVIWSALVMQRFPQAWEVWETQTVGRALGELDKDPVWFYAPVLLWMTLPWTPTILTGIPRSWRRAWKEGDAHERFLWIWLFTHLVIVTASVNKHENYILAALPVFSLIAAPRLAVLGERLRHRRPLINGWEAAGLMLACVGTAAAIMILGQHKWPWLARPLFAVAAVVGVGGPLATVLAATRRSAAGAYMALIVYLVCYIGVTGWIIPGCDQRAAAARFAKTVRACLEAGREVHVFRIGKDPAVFYLDEPVQRVPSFAALKQHFARHRRLLVFSDLRRARSLKRLGTVRILRRMSVPDDAAPPEDPTLVLAEVSPERLAAEPPQGKGRAR